jgi:hypothetical protein
MSFLLSNHLPVLMGVGVLVIALGSSIVLGGFRVGYLKKSLELAMPTEDAASFWENMQRRLGELGFKKAEQEGRYLQGGTQFGNPVSFTHSRTRKELTVRFRESGPGQLTVTVALAFLRPIGADTGESAYRDAVLDYVTGKTDHMVLVANRNLMALNSLAGGILACILAVFVVALKRWSFWPALLVLTITEMVLGLLGLWAALYRPAEISGKSVAAAGICLSLSAMTITFFAMHGDMALHGAH